MTERIWDAMLTGVQAHMAATAEEAGDLALMADTLRNASNALRRGGSRQSIVELLSDAAAKLETMAGKRAAGLERISQLIGDVRGDSLDDTRPIDRTEFNASNENDL